MRLVFLPPPDLFFLFQKILTPHVEQNVIPERFASHDDFRVYLLYPVYRFRLNFSEVESGVLHSERNRNQERSQVC